MADAKWLASRMKRITEESIAISEQDRNRDAYSEFMSCMEDVELAARNGCFQVFLKNFRFDARSRLADVFRGLLKQAGYKVEDVAGDGRTLKVSWENAMVAEEGASRG